MAKSKGSDSYRPEHIITLEWKEHIRTRPGMYIGKLGDGSTQDDGIYVLIKEVLDNSIDEFMMNFGKRINIDIDDKQIRIRDFGRGVPLTKVVDVSSKMNTGAKYDSEVFKKSIGLNGVGIKAVNALSNSFIIKSFREGKYKEVRFVKGEIKKEYVIRRSKEKNGTEVIFIPDDSLFIDYNFKLDYIKSMIQNYVYLNKGLSIYLNKEKFFSENGLLDLLSDKLEEKNRNYPIVHLVDKDFEIAFTHSKDNKEKYYTYVNGQNTTQGGTHLLAFRTAFVKSIRDFYKKQYDAYDIRYGLSCAISIKIEEPVFESQTKTKLGSTTISPDGEKISTFIQSFLTKKLETFLHINKNSSDLILKGILQSEKLRKEINEVKKLSRKNAKRIKVHNKKLRDCRVHFNTKHKNANESTIFITEGDSASGSITKTRDVNTQAVFSLKGKPLNTYNKSKKVIYENEEFNLILSALNIDDGDISKLRYNKIVIATDADVDGMHIRLLLMTFFLKFFPDIVSNGHLYILDTPLFRVRSRKTTKYCYDEKEKEKALKSLKNAEITRFKGLGEISPDEFKFFIGEDMRLQPILIDDNDDIDKLLNFYMGKNTKERQEFIVNNLKLEE